MKTIVRKTILALVIPAAVVLAWFYTTIYGLDKFIIPNELGRFGLNDRSDLIYNEDCSFDILIQKEKPSGEMIKNWLPNDGKPSLIVLRFYLPTDKLLKDEWKYPKIIYHLNLNASTHSVISASAFSLLSSSHTIYN